MNTVEAIAQPELTRPPEGIASHFRLLLALEHQAVLVLDEALRIVAANRTAEQLYGYDQEQLRRMDLIELSDEKEATQATLAELAAGRTVQIPGRLHRRRNGEVLFVDISTLLETYQGKRYVCAIIRDISASLQLAERLQESEARFEALAEASAVGLLIHDEGKIVRASTRLCEISGYSLAELYQLRVEDLVTSGSQDVLAEAQRQEHQNPYELMALCKDGSTTLVEVSVRRFTARGRKLRLAVIRDVRKEKLGSAADGGVDAQLKQQQRLESIGILAASVAHEINNPITGIINYAELIKRRVEHQGELASEAAERLLDATRQIDREASRVGTMVRDLLSFARPERETWRLVRVTDVVEGTLGLLRMVVSKDQVTLEIEIPDDLPLLRCLPQQLQQVLMNLVTNARDALNQRHAGYHEDKTIIVSAREMAEEQRWVRISVEDHGIGIAQEQLARIFTPFYSTKGQRKGTGLGLSLSRAIVAEHGGRLSVESELGAYTRFMVDLPVSEPLRY